MALAGSFLGAHVTAEMAGISQEEDKLVVRAVGLWLTFLFILNVCVTVVFSCAISMKAHTETNTEAVSLLAVLFTSHTIVCSLPC